MTDTDLELQLKVWKELAISKQILMRAATDALKLDPNCTPQELEAALKAAVERAAKADAAVSKAQEQAKEAVAAAEKKLAETQKALTASQAAHAEAVAQQQKLEQQITDIRDSNAKTVNDLKARLAEKDKEIKGIHAVLSDTPQNVVKKLKTLQKQKKDEADARKLAEDQAAALRKDKKTLEERVNKLQAAQEAAVQLAERYRELHTLSESLHAQLKPLVADASSLAALPALDTALLESIEKSAAPEEKKPAAKAKR
ncbi:MAG: hypothetical protein AB7U81_00030 [Thiohalomonadaceae bacterium]